MEVARQVGLIDEVAARAAPVTLAGQRQLPLVPALAPLVPWGVRRGSVIGAGGPSSTSLALALLAEASASGSWVAAVGLPGLGLAAAAGLGLALDRLALVPDPGPRWVTVVAALLDGLDAVLARPAGRPRP
ncbi:MAG: hypothetical protein ACRD0D_05610, partial [Acidimicrobiales bacterium]